MKQLSKSQLVALWLCFLYFGVALAVIGARAAFGFLRLGSEYRDAQVPREVLLRVADSASRDFRLHTVLVAVGVAVLGLVLVWLTRSREA